MIKQILYIEDDPALGKLIQTKLRRLDYQVTIAVTGEEGLDILQTQVFELVIVDYYLPGIDGLEVIKYLQDKKIDIPIIMLSGSDNLHIAIEAMKLGVSDYVLKEVDKNYLQLLTNTIDKVLEKQKLKERLRISEARYKDLVATVPGVIYQYYFKRNGEQGFHYISPQCFEIFGYNPQELLENWNIDQYLYEEDLPQIKRGLLGLFIEKTETWHIEFRLKTKDNQLRWARAQSRVVYLQEDEIELHGVITDTTDYHALQLSLIEAKKMAEQASAAKSQFVSRMSHELRAPLNTVLGFAQLLSSDSQNPLIASQLEYVEQINKAGWYLLELLNEILDLSRIEAGKIALSLKPLNPNNIIKECYDMILPVAQKRNVKVKLDLAVENCMIMVDDLRLREALLNLLSNAIKYNKDNGDVLLFTELKNNDFLSIAVKDTGIGISEENLKNLFQPFNRLGQEFSQKEGAGIGLVITKRYMELMSGSLKVISQQGQGSTFWIELPLVTVDAEHVVGDYVFDQKLTHLPKDKEYNILYIDDQLESIQLLQKLFMRYPQLCLHTASRGQLGIETAQTMDLDVIFLDIKLPDIDGFEVFKKLKEGELTTHIPVVALSAEAMTKEIQHAKTLGFYEYLTKPLIIHDFQKVLSDILN